VTRPGRTPEELAEAGISGLCADGRWELAQDAIRAVDIGAILTNVERRHEP
jgi:hypothetical protein